jgi:hypothetical protein
LYNFAKSHALTTALDGPLFVEGRGVIVFM